MTTTLVLLCYPTLTSYGIYNDANNKGILSEAQASFRTNHSTIDQLFNLSFQDLFSVKSKCYLLPISATWILRWLVLTGHEVFGITQKSNKNFISHYLPSQ